MARMKTLNLVYENISFFILYPECREIQRYILGTQAQLWLLSGTFRLRKEQDAPKDALSFALGLIISHPRVAQGLS